MLHTHDRFGRRIDEVEFHPSYHALMTAAVGAGLHGTPWTGAIAVAACRARGRLHALHRARALDAVPDLHDLRRDAGAARQRRPSTPTGARSSPAAGYDPALVPWRDKPGVTMGMGMTEKQGGSDVRANTTQAVRDRQRCLGRALCDHRPQVVLLGADVRCLPGAGAGAGRALSCFFLPRVLPDGTRNEIRIQRLKDKLGNKANASSEVEFHGASAWLVGEEGPRHPADPRDGHHDPARLRAGHQRADAAGAGPGAEPHGAAQGLRQAR